MDFQQLFRQLNWVDWLILLALLGYLAAGVRRGFVMGILDLLGMVVSLAAGVLGYRQLSALVLQWVEVPSAIATLGAFLLLVLIAQAIYSAIVNLVFRIGRPIVLLLGPLYLLDRALGALPGLVKGLIFATLVLLPFALFPLVPQLSAGIERSSMGSRLVVAAVDAAPGLESLMGRELNDGLSFLTPPQTEEGMKMNFGLVGELEPDPAAEERMLQLVNAEREKAGLRPLQMDEELRKVARAHSREMFEMSYFAHNSPASGTPFDRMRKAGIPFGLAGENLAYAPNVQIAHEGLMNSPGHRANILRPEFRKVGIGVLKSEFRGSMFSQEFTN
ncbi:MAG: CvpA family protein [Chloroflexota bacterium]